MFIKNKKTGLVQECHNKDVIAICKKDSDSYAVAEEKNALKMEEENSAEEKQGNKTVNDMTLAELKELAKEKGIECASSLNKAELLATLRDVV